MKPQVKLPRELEEEILSRLPPHSLVRFRSVCKRWNALLHEKCFINSHMSRSHPQFIFLTDPKLYSINIIGLDSDHPTPELRELPFSDFPDMNTDSGQTIITAFDEFLFCKSWSKPTVLWNPWLKQVELIEHKDTEFYPYGLGYNSTLPQKVYKIFGFYLILREVDQMYVPRVAIYDCASHAFKFIDTLEDWSLREADQPQVSLNGNLYWVARNLKTRDYFIQSFDFSEEMFKPFCSLPCPKYQSGADDLVLAVFKGDRFSLLRQCNVTRKIEILVMETKTTDIDNGEVVWINLMTLPASNLPNFNDQIYDISYFIYDKTLIMCWCNFITRTASIYILRGGMFKVFQIISTGFLNACSCVYAPNFTPVPLLRV